MTNWQIIFYNHLHPHEPRCYAEVQFTNKRICVFTKHKRYRLMETIRTLYHETIHILTRRIFKKQSLLDTILDELDYRVSKLIHLKSIIEEKGWRYFNKSTLTHKDDFGNTIQK